MRRLKKTGDMCEKGFFRLIAWVFLFCGCAGNHADTAPGAGGSPGSLGSGGDGGRADAPAGPEAIGGSAAGVGGAMAETGGTGTETGGAVTGTGGAGMETGGAVSGGGGAATGTAGAATGTGGAVTGTAGGGAGDAKPEEVCPAAAPQICHKFFALDNAENRLIYVDEFAPEKGWSVSVGQSPRQLEVVSNPKGSGEKAILVSTSKGYEEYDLTTGSQLVGVTAEGTGGIEGAARLPNGNTLLGDDKGQLTTITPTGSALKHCSLPGSGSSLRVLHREPEAGHLYYGMLDEVFVSAETCEQVFSAKLPPGSKAYAVRPRAGGGLWATTGEPSTLLEYDAAGKILNQVGGEDVHSGLGLDWSSGFSNLPSGNLVFANWLGHLTPAADTPHLVEFTPANELVWKWGNQKLARQITNALVLK